eukprot:scaffold50014_cov45-Attheya_sp.AAC.2
MDEHVQPCQVQQGRRYKAAGGHRRSILELKQESIQILVRVPRGIQRATKVPDDHEALPRTIRMNGHVQQDPTGLLVSRAL